MVFVIHLVFGCMDIGVPSYDHLNFLGLHSVLKGLHNIGVYCAVYGRLNTIAASIRCIHVKIVIRFKL